MAFADKLEAEQLTLTSSTQVSFPEKTSSPENSSDSPARSRKTHSWKWLLLTVNICVATGAIAVGCFLWLISLPPVTNCQKLSTISSDSKRLHCAQQAAQSGNSSDLLAALDLIEPWGETHPLYLQKQQQLERWSREILKLAQHHAYQGDLDESVDLAQRIPHSSSLYDRAQSSIQDWQTEWQRGEAVYAESQEALRKTDWNSAQDQVKQLSQFSHPYWRSQRSVALAQQIALERRAHNISNHAQSLASEGSTDAIQNAIVKARTLDQNTYSWEMLQPKLKVWHEILLHRGLDLWYEGQLDQSIALGQLVSKHAEFKTEAEHLITLSRARKRAIESTPNWEPTVAHLWHLNQAIKIGSDITSDSKFYPQAVSSVESWKQQLSDLQQLHHAQIAANFGTKQSYSYAIQHAEKSINPDRPRRLQSQTMIAHWHKEIERIEDRPHLLLARQIAASGTRDDLRAAINHAQNIRPGRALYNEAQNYIGQWYSELHLMEDRPILNRARLLADQGNLQEAINTAGQIRPGRSLYPPAQEAIRRWRNELYKSQVVEPVVEPEKDLTELLEPSINDRFPPEFSSPSPLSPLAPSHGENDVEGSQPPIAIPPIPLPEGSIQDSSTYSPFETEQVEPTLPNIPQAERGIPPQPSSTSDASPEEIPTDQNGITEVVDPTEVVNPEFQPSPPQSLGPSSFLPTEDNPALNHGIESNPVETSQQDDSSESFDLHAELSESEFSLLSAGSLFAGL